MQQRPGPGFALARVAAVFASLVFVLVAWDDLGPVGDSTGATVYGAAACVGVALVAASTVLSKGGPTTWAKVARIALVVWVLPTSLLAVFFVLLTGVI